MEQHEYFRLFHDIGTADYDLLTQKLKTKTFKKGDFITVSGQIQRELYFVKSGVQMSYFDTDNKTHVTQPFADKTQRNGALAFLKSLLNDQDWFQELWDKRQAISDIPTLFIWGMKDPVIKPHYLDKFQTGFTNSKTVQLETCGHFPQEEQSERVTKSILDFLAEKENDS